MFVQWWYRLLCVALGMMISVLLISGYRNHQAAQAGLFDISAGDDESIGTWDIEEEEKKHVALTFDDGPKAGKTDVLLEGLRERGIHATFFLIGCQIEGNEEIVKQMKADGHQIGLHTFSHVELSKLSEYEQKQEIEKGKQALEAVIGPGNYSLRPPFGSVDKHLKSWINVPIVLWSVDTRDWTGISAQKIKKAVLTSAKDGDIILMHDIFTESIQGALMAIDEMKEDYEFMTVEELESYKESLQGK